VCILSTDGHELSDTTRHFIVYGEFIFLSHENWRKRYRL
jgi:hypothetical protein